MLTLSLYLQKIIKFFSRPPNQSDLVKYLVAKTADLELKPKRRVPMAPVTGMWGTVYLSGSSLPVIEYIVFDEALMEFIHVRVEIALPNQIRFISKVHDPAIETLCGPIETKPSYVTPFYVLTKHLFNYFPLIKPQDKESDETNETENVLERPSQAFIQGEKTEGQL